MSLVVSNLSVSINNAPILTDVSFVCDNVLSIIGPSGAGKTTLLRAIAGLEKHSGTITLHDTSLTQPVEQRAVGYVEQRDTLFPHMTVAQNVAYPLKVRKTPTEQRRTQTLETLRQFHIDHLAHKMPHEISGGEQQRVTIARALIADPQLLLFDEPFRSLDAMLQQEMIAWLKDILAKRHTPTLFITHDIREARAVSKKALVLQNGASLASGTWDDLASSEHPTVTRLLTAF